MPEMVTNEGMDINPDDFDGAGWTTALGARRKRDPAKNAAAPAAAKTTANTAQKDDFNTRSRSTVQKVVAASRLPRLPKDQIKVIVWPRGGLDVSKADLVLLARALTMAAALTDQEASEDTICPNKIQRCRLCWHPENSYESRRFRGFCLRTAPENTCKGVIRNVDPSIEDHTLRSMIVNQRNPTAIEVKRIKNTHVVAILFDGLRVPKNVMCGTALVPCSLYKRQVDVCHACGRVGHRADVCHHSKEERSKCHNCGEALPNGAAEAHICTPKCKLCEGDHPTGDRCCSKRFHIPYVARRRRRQRQNRSEKEVNPDEVKDPADMHQERALLLHGPIQVEIEVRSGWRRTHRSGEVKIQLQATWQENDLGRHGRRQRLRTNNFKASSHKRRAVDIETDDDTFDVGDFMSEVSEAPSNASTSDNKAKKRRKTKSKKTNRSTQSHENNVHAGPGTLTCAFHTLPTTRTNSGPLGVLEQHLQQALDTTEAFLKNAGLKLSPSKSELLLCKRGPRKGQPLSYLPVHLSTRDGGSIPRYNTIKVLGVVIGAYSGDNVEALKRIEKSVLNFTRVISLGGQRDLVRSRHSAPLHAAREVTTLQKLTQAITVDPIPRNIHPTHNEGRRKARAKVILARIMRNETQILFVDAARYWNRGAYAVSVVDAHGSLVNAATVVTNFTHEAAKMAIAVALQSCRGASIIYSDSRTAIRTFSAALVSSKAATAKGVLVPTVAEGRWATLLARQVVPPAQDKQGLEAKLHDEDKQEEAEQGEKSNEGGVDPSRASEEAS
ncbi:hypothetical protein HPB52_005437 [Rhipicephalus sanguineus]|uniref:CCHC-type domain-containing protein n=1 Tax=Rhipicephalus sanguineus TaxID=34632 RepID=A0A9D4SNT0_RHISA|nr:hypothetical protein HPB52_005437 [Rhipicephalus sanguineus]